MPNLAKKIPYRTFFRSAAKECSLVTALDNNEFIEQSVDIPQVRISQRTREQSVDCLGRQVMKKVRDGVTDILRSAFSKRRSPFPES